MLANILIYAHNHIKYHLIEATHYPNDILLCMTPGPEYNVYCYQHRPQEHLVVLYTEIHNRISLKYSNTK